MRTKGQAAFEFLSTYGWAVFAALAVIAVLTAFGFSDLRNSIPETCYLGDAFVCDGATADYQGLVLIELSPVQKVHIERLTCTYPDGTPRVENYPAEPVLMPNQKEVIACQPPTLDLPPTKDKIQVSIVYHLNETGALPRVSSGEIVAEIRDYAIDITAMDIFP